jgi:hypothetical protein
MTKLPENYFLLKVDFIKTRNNFCYKLLRKVNDYLLEDTNLSFDVNTENEALTLAWEHIDIIGDSVLDEPLLIKNN